ncbi:hypothetical protein HKD37_11G032198 [Glycine soja]
MKILYEVYMNPVELPWEASRFRIPNIDAKFYITHADMAEIISGIWMCGTSRGDGSVYGFLEPQSIHIVTSYIILFTNAMKTISSYLEGMSRQAAPRWIEPKSRVQSGGYKCGYYVIHWMWCIVNGGLKDDWNKWFSDGSALDVEAMTIIRKNWTTYFLAIRNNRC